MNNRNVFDDILIAFLATYALMAFSFEKYIPENIMKPFRAIIIIAFFAVWLWYSFKNGRMRGVIFPIFAVLFWILPKTVIFLANDGPKIFRMSIIMYVLSEFSEIIFGGPMEEVSGIFGISSVGAAAVLLLLCAASYLLGIFTGENEE